MNTTLATVVIEPYFLSQTKARLCVLVVTASKRLHASIDYLKKYLNLLTLTNISLHANKDTPKLSTYDVHI